MRKVFVRGVLLGTTNRKPSDLKRKKLFVKQVGDSFFFGGPVTL